MASSTSGPGSQERTYVGGTTEDAQAEADADRLAAAQEGWAATGQYWDTTQPQPTLVVRYEHDPQAVRPKRRGLSARSIVIIVIAIVVIAIVGVFSSSDEVESPAASGPPAALDSRTAEPTPVARTPRPATLTSTPRPAKATPKPEPKDPPGYVRRADFGKAWPFKVKAGTLGCNDYAATFTDPQGKRWAINGVAMSLGLPELNDSIWRNDPDIPGLKVGVGEMIDLALELCEQEA